MFYNDTPVLLSGTPTIENKTKWKEIVSSDEFTISLDLKRGNAQGEIWSNDLSEEYVNFNKSE
jgi:N-acetylglutamate synthase/N-acetylornithine aminotransferase